MEKIDLTKPPSGSAKPDADRPGWVSVLDGNGELSHSFWFNGVARFVHRADRGGVMAVFCDDVGGGYEVMPVALPKLLTAVLEAKRRHEAFQKAWREGERAAAATS